jgi:hypothetical protein
MVNAAMPLDGPVQLGSVQLPAGVRLGEGDEGGPLLWATSDLVPSAGRVWQELTDMHSGTGLVPILLGFLDGEDGRPWDSWELDDRCSLESVDRLDPALVLAQSWRDSVPSEEELEDEPEAAAMIAPYGSQFPGLARGQDEPLSDAELSQALGWFGPARIGLVPAGRAADVLALVGYNGTVNRYGTPEMLTAALRSWEDRFGAVLVEVGFAYIRLLARRPPRSQADAQAVAAELWSFCDEFWLTDGHGDMAVREVEAITDAVIKSPIWSLWLD